MNLFTNTAIPNAIPDIWEKIVYHLNGSCTTLEQALEDSEAPELENNDAFLSYLDNNIFRCNCCSWWCDISEMSEYGDWECRDCVPEEE